MPVALFVRHGRSTANTSGVLSGWTPGVELDDRGRDQAAALAARLQRLPVRRVVTSPLTRCRMTTDILAAAVPEATVDVDDRLGECRYGAWTGRRLGDLVREPLWRVVQEHASAARFPDGEEYPGESMAQMATRAMAAVRDVDAEVTSRYGADALWVAVSHGDVIKAILADASGAHLDHLQRFVVDPGSLSVVRYTERRPFVIRVNDTCADLSTLIPSAPSPSGEEATDNAAMAGEGAAPGDPPGDPDTRPAGENWSAPDPADAVPGGGAGGGF